MLGHRRQLLYVIEEAAVAVHRDHLSARIAGLDAQRGREAVAERALVARGEKRARLVDREEGLRPVADLRALGDQEAVVRELRPDRHPKVSLRMD